MLARSNRITSGSDYKAVVRRGRRIVSANTVTYLRKGSAGAPARFGFIVARNVGNAVKRNRVRRRLKAASYELLAMVPPGTEVVVRALPASFEVGWPTLRAELSNALSQANVAKGSTGQ